MKEKILEKEIKMNLNEKTENENEFKKKIDQLNEHIKQIEKKTLKKKFKIDKWKSLYMVLNKLILCLLPSSQW